MEDGISARSINRKLSSLKGFTKFLLREGVIKKDPTLKIVAPKSGSKLPSFLEFKEIEDLFAKVEYSDDFSGLRDRLILELLYATGIRLMELISLETSKASGERGVIKVLGKGNKEREIPVSDELIRLVKEYLKLRGSTFSAIDHPFLLVTDKGKQLYPKFVYRKVKKYLSFISTLDKRSPHVLRHTFATHLVNKGAELNAVKELLGHASLAATQVYTHNSIEQLQEIYKKAHPKAEE